MTIPHSILERLLLVVALCPAFLSVHAWGYPMENPSDDPDLKVGLSSATSSRSTAEAALMNYLEREKDPHQRARAYFRLGMLFSVNSRPDIGEPLEREKAEHYFRQVLTEVPEGLSTETLFARTQLASLGSTTDEKFERDLELLKWMNSLDPESFEQRIMLHPSETDRPVVVQEREVQAAAKEGADVSLKITRTRLPEKYWRERRGQEFRDLFDRVRETTVMNLESEAEGSSNPKGNEQRLRRELDPRPIESVTTLVPMEKPDAVTSVTPLTPTVPVPPTDLEIPPRAAPPASPVAEFAATPAESPSTFLASRNGLILLVLAGLAAIGLGILLWLWARHMRRRRIASA